MKDYLDGLLHEPDAPSEATERAAKLLEQASVSLPELELQTEPTIDEPAVDVPEVVTEPQEALEIEPARSPEYAPIHDQLESTFQALFFEVAGLTMAVPLTTLGGIHNLDKVGPLIGKPNWFMGVMLHREEKLNVVDTAQWVMPEKYDQNLAETLNYQYLIMLGDSPWGLASDKLVNTVTLSKDDVKWRESQGKRPWLAGMVKEKMCALVDVYQLISMLNNGLGSNDQMP